MRGAVRREVDHPVCVAGLRPSGRPERLGKIAVPVRAVEQARPKVDLLLHGIHDVPVVRLHQEEIGVVEGVEEPAEGIVVPGVRHVVHLPALPRSVQPVFLADRVGIGGDVLVLQVLDVPLLRHVGGGGPIRPGALLEPGTKFVLVVCPHGRRPPSNRGGVAGVQHPKGRPKFLHCPHRLVVFRRRDDLSSEVLDVRLNGVGLVRLHARQPPEGFGFEALPRTGVPDPSHDAHREAPDAEECEEELRPDA